LLGLCGPVVLEEQETTQTRKSLADALDTNDTVTSPWQDAIRLLCRAIVIDEKLEEEEAWECIMAETRCLPRCGEGFERDYEDDVAVGS